MTVVTCPNCGAEVPAGFKFCGECGAKLAALADAATVPAQGRGGSVVADTKQDGLVAVPRDEFRDVTVLFADVMGFTALSELLDPEALHALMNDCFQGLGQIVQAHGGHIDKYIGDSIMALFGAPTAHEDDPLRAGEAALAMQAFLASFRAPAAKASAGSFRMRIGINCGLVLAGSIGSEGKRDYSVMGDAVNTASRLEGQAKPGCILVSDAYKQRVERQFNFSGPQSLMLKGKDKPVTAWELVREAGDGAVETQTEARRFFTGRQHEIEQIAGQLARRGGRDRPLWLDVIGPLGIGKTHLVNEALRHVPGLSSLHVVARPATRLRPFALARRLLLGVTSHLSGTRSPPQSREAFVCALESVGQELEPYINALWYLAAPDTLSLKVPDPDPLTFRRTVERGLEQLLGNIALRLPQLVIVLDAFDFADAETARFLETAYSSGPRSLPPIIATARRDDAPAQQSVTSITLAPLNRADAEYLALHAAGAWALDTATLHNILKRAQGVPLFILELVRSLQEDAAVPEGGQSAPLSSLPSSLLGVMSSRLDRLEPAQRDVLAQCAVQGVEFSADVALAVWSSRGGVPEALAGHLKDLEDRAFIEAPDRKSRRYAFTQALMQNACYDSMLRRDRRSLHRDVAAALVVRSGGAQAVGPEQLAAHYELSEQWLDAAIQNMRAGHRAADLYANADALARYERTVKALGEHAEQGETERRIAFEAHAGAAQVHLRIGSYGDVERDARAMEAHARDARERAEAMRLMAQGRLHRGDLSSAAELLARAEESASAGEANKDDVSRPDGPAANVACHVLYDLADLCFRKGQNEASRTYIARCRTLVPQACPELFRLDILEGRVAHTEGRFHDAVDLYRRAHNAAAGSGSLSEEALTSNYMGNAARDVGQYEDAEHYFKRALDIWTRVGLTESMAGAHNNLANLAISRGEAQRAEHHYGLALKAFEQISSTAGTALARTNLAILAIEQGRAEDGIANAAEAQAALLSTGHRMLLGLACVIHGEALLSAERIVEASAQFAWICSEYDEGNHPLAVAGAMRGVGRAALANGDAVNAVAPLEKALALYERLERQQEAGRTELFLARAKASCGDGAAARRLLESARVRFDRIGARGDHLRAERALDEMSSA